MAKCPLKPKTSPDSYRNLQLVTIPALCKESTQEDNSYFVIIFYCDISMNENDDEFPFSFSVICHLYGEKIKIIVVVIVILGGQKKFIFSVCVLDPFTTFIR